MGDPFLREVARAIRCGRLLRARDSVLVAVSGGADSVALVLALGALDRGGWRIGVAHVNHHLRGRESDRDQRLVERLARRLGYPVHVAQAKVGRTPNLEERAREARYRALGAIARRRGYRVIATAHTIDDQAETVLHHVARGSGGAGLAGIRPRRADGVVRPLLDVSRAQVVAFLRRRGVRHRNDRSNRDPRFTRNRLRAEVLPLLERRVNPRVKEALGRLARVSLSDEEFLQRAALRAERRAIERGSVICARLAKVHPALQRRILRAWLGRVREGSTEIGLDQVERVRELALGGRVGRRLSVPGGTVVRRDRRLEWSGRRASSRSYARRLEPGREIVVSGWRIRARSARPPVSPGRWRAVFDAGAVDGAPLRVRSPKPGDRIRPLRLGGSKKLQDVFVDAKAPREERGRWPVVEIGGVVAWVAGLVRSEEALVGPASRRLLVVEARRLQRRPPPLATLPDGDPSGRAKRVAGEYPMCYGREVPLGGPPRGGRRVELSEET